MASKEAGLSNSSIPREIEDVCSGAIPISERMRARQAAGILIGAHYKGALFHIACRIEDGPQRSQVTYVTVMAGLT